MVELHIPELDELKKLMEEIKAGQVENKELMNEKAAAEYLGVSPNALNCWRTNRKTPVPYVKIGSRVLYDKKDLNSFIEFNRVTK